MMRESFELKRGENKFVVCCFFICIFDLIMAQLGGYLHLTLIPQQS